MNERTTLEKIAPTIEEAIADGLTELGMKSEQVDVEILDSGSRGLFGVGIRQARVRITVKQENPAPLKAAETIREEKPKKPRVERPKKPEKTEKTEKVEPASDISEEALQSLDDNLLFISRQTVAEMLEMMNVKAKVEVRYGEPDEEGQKPVNLDIRGSDLAVLIGRRAETLNALQYLANLTVSKKVEHWVQIVIDVEGYRARREQQLRQMARRIADQAIRTGRRQVLEPMASYERRIVHLELRDHPRVLTQSIGEEPARKVTIVPKQ
jgi:spoIIIJ-associated protein